MIFFIAFLAIFIPALSCDNLYVDITEDMRVAKENFDAFIRLSDKPKESESQIITFLESLVKITANLESAGYRNVADVLNNKLDDAKTAAIASVKFAQLIGDLDSVEPLFKNFDAYTEVINLFTKNEHAVNQMYYNPFMAAFHVNDLEAWTKFRENYLQSKLDETVASITKSQTVILKLLSEKDCNKVDVGKYCAFTFGEFFKVLAMRGAARAVKGDSKIDNVNIDYNSVLSSCLSTLKSC